MSCKFITVGDVIRAFATSLLVAVLVVALGFLYLRMATEDQTPNGLGG